MSRPKGWTIEKSNAVRHAVWDYLKKNADEEGYLVFNSASFALDRGVDSTTIQRCVRKIAEDGKIEYTRAPADGVHTNSGLLIRLLQNERKPEEQATISALRKCPKCGELAHDIRSRFCYRCGTSLLTEKELLKERCNNFLPRLFRAIPDASVGNEATELIHKLMEIAFKEA